jgi:hypothetical protein
MLEIDARDRLAVVVSKLAFVNAAIRDRKNTSDGEREGACRALNACCVEIRSIIDSYRLRTTITASTGKSVRPLNSIVRKGGRL